MAAVLSEMKLLTIVTIAIPVMLISLFGIINGMTIRLFPMDVLMFKAIRLRHKLHHGHLEFLGFCK